MLNGIGLKSEYFFLDTYLMLRTTQSITIGAPSVDPAYQPSVNVKSIQDEGNALFDMAAAMPGLKSISG